MKKNNIDKVQKFYEKNIMRKGNIEAGLWGEIGNQKKRFNFIKKLILKIGISGDKLVDIGCGDGYFLLQDIIPMNIFNTYVGIDLLRLGSSKRKKVSFLVGDYRNFFKKCNKASLVTCIGILGTPCIDVEYEFKSLISFSEKILKKDGYIIITASNKTSNVGESFLSKKRAEKILEKEWSGLYSFFDMKIDNEYAILIHFNK